ncbi:MAG TPA: ATP-binding protein [Candidatus Baltobacteraceae bacterium]|nr:ATP-binding protein [Candidatus Baltobacteraceae bacterium]
MAVVTHPWYFETDCPRDALAGRPLLERYLSDHTREGSDLFPASLVYGELISNVIKHAPDGGVRVWLEPHREKFVLCINDAGDGFSEGDVHAVPSDEAESGRGLFIVQNVCDQVSYERAECDGFIVRAVLPLHRRDS